MRIGFIPVMFVLFIVLQAEAQQTDSAKAIQLENLVISESYQKSVVRNSVLQVDVVDEKFLREHFTGNLIQSLGHIPGVNSMDIGAGFSKPVIRGMGFNRISVTENGIKQEGQQWGADHGLEIDAFNVERVVIRKGPASLLYGSDAMVGAIEISRFPVPDSNQLFGETVLLGKSINGTLGGSVMLGAKKDVWFTKLRFSVQDFGDYRIPADTIVYLTQKMPVYGRKLKNTAGRERDAAFYLAYHKDAYSADISLNNTYQKVGFFPGAHGIPDLTRLQDDGDSRNTGLPYSRVNHLKITTHQQYIRKRTIAAWDLGYQNNSREEWSLFHTHYGNVPAPVKEPDKELAFLLDTYSSSVKIKRTVSPALEYTSGWDLQYQQNRIAGYSFLLPEYNRFTTGLLWLATLRPNKDFSVSGGIRFDYGQVDIAEYEDVHLKTYLQERAYADEVIEQYKRRSYKVNRYFGDFSGSLGIVWNPAKAHLIKMNIGRSFRLPAANELASNGVHHGTFRHEQGDPSLLSESGWQSDISYAYENGGILVSVSPFIGWFNNYIYLKPTGEWSILPHAGQIYRYTGAKALFAGTEASLKIDISSFLHYSFTGEYLYTRNMDERIPLSFSPPASMRNTLTANGKNFRVYVEMQTIADQNRIAKNEDATPGANLFHTGTSVNIPLSGIPAEVTLSIHNLFNTKYFNHLSFYRKVEIPEPGRNFQMMIKIPFVKDKITGL
ncbi:MAG: TonB-dependent receptor [Prevotellaceae bacterium]|jgi:iron complex outermembrane receptor protein|nr:TonB-dependent receptor [Prevotellaceae bacterium]